MLPNDNSHSPCSLNLCRDLRDLTGEKALGWNTHVFGFGENFRQCNVYYYYFLHTVMLLPQPHVVLMLSSVITGLCLPCSLGLDPAVQFWSGKSEGIQLILLNVLIGRCMMFYDLLQGLSIPIPPDTVSLSVVSAIQITEELTADPGYRNHRGSERKRGRIHSYEMILRHGTRCGKGVKKGQVPWVLVLPKAFRRWASALLLEPGFFICKGEGQ